MNFNEDIKKIVEFIPKFEQLLSRLNKLESANKQTYDDREIRKLITESKVTYDDREIRKLINDISVEINGDLNKYEDLELKLVRMFDSFRNTESTQSAREISNLKSHVEKIFESFRSTESTQSARAISLLTKRIESMEKNNGKR